MSANFRLLVKKYFFEILLFSAFFIFASLLMWKTFRVGSDGNMQLASRVWSDFAATLPLIRSFSFGSNFPPEYPIFAGPPIRYHFVFFMIVGLLEKAGLRIDWALNLPSIAGFFLLCISIYLLGKVVFKSRGVGIISSLLFLFNGSFGFLEFFKKNPLSLNTFSDILGNTEFTSFGPYDGKIVSAFWSLNIFTNQRHLALAYASFLFLTLFLYKFSQHPEKFTWTKAIVLGICLGFFPFIHLAAFAMMGILILISFVLYPKLRLKLFVVGITALTLATPQYVYMGSPAEKIKLFNPGYLVENETLLGYLTYWCMNLGFSLLFAPIGFILANKLQRKFFLPFLVLFAVGNLFQFSPEIAANHKFFNLFIIGANIFTALFLIKLWKTRIIGKVVVPLLLIPLVLTGVIDLFPIVNDRNITLTDYPNDPTVKFIVENTPKDSVFINATYLYDPASLAGRKIHLGWPYFSWGTGYDTHKRHESLQSILKPLSLKVECDLLEKEGINFIEIQNPTYLEETEINYAFFEKNFEKIHYNRKNNILIYDPSKKCTGLTSITK